MTTTPISRVSQTYRSIHDAVTSDHLHPAVVGTMFGMYSSAVCRIVARVAEFDAGSSRKAA